MKKALDLTAARVLSQVPSLRDFRELVHIFGCALLVLLHRFVELHLVAGLDQLPTSSTCFFVLRVKSYSSEERMMDRFLYAIRHCQAIDGDYTLRGEVEHHPEELAEQF